MQNSEVIERVDHVFTTGVKGLPPQGHRMAMAQEKASRVLANVPIGPHKSNGVPASAPVWRDLQGASSSKQRVSDLVVIEAYIKHDGAHPVKAATSIGLPYNTYYERLKKLKRLGKLPDLSSTKSPESLSRSVV